MTDKELYEGIEHLKEWLNKVKPKDYKKQRMGRLKVDNDANY